MTDTNDGVMRQQAPYPVVLDQLVDRLRYRPGWRFALRDIERDPADTHGAAAGGLTFIVTTLGYDSYHPEMGEQYRVNHHFVVPAATFNEASWLRWLFDCIVKVETHECMEFFALAAACDCPTDRPVTDLLRHFLSCASRADLPPTPSTVRAHPWAGR